MKHKLFYGLVELFFLTLIFSSQTWAQTPSGYVCSVRNDSLLASDIYEFDIYLQNTDLVNVFELATFQAGIVVNSAIVNGGVITASIVGSSSELTAVQQPTSVDFDGPSNCIRLAPRGGPGHGSGTIISTTSPGIRVVRIRLTNSIDFGQSSPDFTFNFTSSPYNTIVSAYDQSTTLNTIITNPSFHSVASMTNPILNGTITTYNVTGAGTEPVSVGLNGSQSGGVNYLLYRNTVPQGSPVDGTGSAITFGNQSEGTYTVKGHRIATYMYSDMTGSAIVTSACDPVSITSQPVSTSICAGTGSASFTVAVGGESPFVYQWQYNNGSTWVSVSNGTPAGASYTNANTTTLGVSGITAAGSYQYRCYVTNCGGGRNATSSVATLTVNAIPAAPTVSLTQPTCETGTGTITVTAPTGAGMTYSINGSTYTNTTGIFSSVNPGTYTVTARSSAGCTSPGTVATINDRPPTPIVSNQSTTISSGATFTVTPTGVPEGTTYTWTAPVYTDGVTGGSAQSTPQTSISGTLTIASGSGTATYTVTPATGSCVGSTFTVTVTVNSTCTPVSITTQPAGTDMCAGTGSASFTVVAGGTAPFTYLWQYYNGSSWASVANGIPAGSSYSGQGTATLGVAGITATGSYQYRCRITNCGGGNNITSSAATLLVVAIPSAPSIGPITPPTCTVSTGSVVLNGLPTPGTWTVTRSPGGVTSSGTGTGTTISPLNPGTYTFTVTNETGCTSPSSAEVVIPVQPPTPTAPVVGTITSPTCAVPTGSVVLSGLPPTGTWTLTRYPGGINTTGSGGSTTISGLAPGTYNYTVTNSYGCTSGLSSNVVINDPPPAPSAPQVGTITQPTCDVSSGSVVLNGLPSGSWTLIRSPGASEIGGSGSSTTVAGIPPGTYTFTVTNSDDCISPSSANVVISAQPPTPTAPVVGAIIHPTCTVATGSVALSGLPSSGTWTLTRSPGGVTTSGTGTSTTVSGIPAGTYTFTVTNSSGCTSPSSANVVINSQPPSPAAPVQTVDCTLGAGNAVVTVTSPTGADLSYRLDAGIFQTSNVFNGVSNGNHTITVRNSDGCTTTGPVFSVSCGCLNPPTVTLSSISGSTCGTTAITVSGNTFGGSATSVSLSENGAGSLIPASTNTSPFSFIYTPASGDVGRIVTITVTTNNPLGTPCTAASATYTLSVNAIPAAPSIGTRTHPSCTVPTGSVILNGLPSTGTWILTRSPDGVITSGTGTSTTVTGLNPGTYTFTITSEGGCTSPSSGNVVINSQPSTPTPPVIGTTTQPTCATSTGSVELTGLPSSGSWIVTRNPGGVTRTGTGTSVTITSIPSGTYTFTVTNSTGCISLPSAEVTIDPQPPTPAAPSVGTITPPTCTASTGSVVLLGLPSTGTWTLTRYPGTVTTTGTGTSRTITGLASGTYNFTVTNENGCISVPSGNVVIPAQPPTPTAPVIGTITQPTFSVPTGSVVLTGLPSGTWVITRYPGAITTTGTGTSRTITGLPAGVFVFTVTNSFGCTSPESNQVIISTPGIPTLIITDPPAVCSPATVDLTRPDVTTGSTPGLTYTYWTDSLATTEYDTPETATTGTYYIKGTTVSGFFDIKPVVVTVDQMPVPFAGPDQILEYAFSTILEASLEEYETGTWVVATGTGVFNDVTDPKTAVTNLTIGDNTLRWTVTSGVCPAASDHVTITVRDLTIPTLITPNMDGKNDYFVLMGIETLGRTEIVIFDRRGMQVYTNSDYQNDWDGVDYNNNPLPDDTYFYVLKAANGRSLSGYIVVRR